MQNIESPRLPGGDKSKTVRIPLALKGGGPNPPPPTLPPHNVATNSPEFSGHILFLSKQPGEKIHVSASDIEVVSSGGVRAVSSPSVLGHLVRVSGASKEIKQGDAIGGCLRGSEKLLLQGSAREQMRLDSKVPTMFLFSDTGDVLEVRLLNQNLNSSVIEAGLRIAPAVQAPKSSPAAVPAPSVVSRRVSVPVPTTQAAPVAAEKKVILEPRKAPEQSRSGFGLNDGLLYVAAATTLAGASTMLSLIQASAGSKVAAVAAGLIAIGGVFHWGLSRIGMRRSPAA